MQSDIGRIIAMIDQRIETLQDLRASFIREFGGEEETHAAEAATGSIQRFPRLPPAQTSGNGNQSRKDEVASFLGIHGPQTRAQMLAQMTIPKGTLAYVLNDKERFRRRRDGTWAVIEKEVTPEK